MVDLRDHLKNKNPKSYMKQIFAIQGILLLVYFIVSFILGALCWPYAINEWLEFADKTAKIAWWQGGLIGLVPGFGHLGLPIAIVTWIIMLFI